MRFEFDGRVWVYPGAAAWHFVSLPREYSDDLKIIGGNKRGFGAVKVTVEVNGITWETSIFPDSKSGSYLLPLKKDIRNKAQLKNGLVAHFVIGIDAA